MTAMTVTRESLAKLATITLSIEREDMPIEGNASAISPEEDAKTYAWIRNQLESGNDWAWCQVQVRAEHDGCIGLASLGCCSYESEREFVARGGYYEDLEREALDYLWQQLEARTAAGRAKTLAAGSRQAITTSYRGPTNRRDSRVIARCEAKRISVPWDNDLDSSANHAAAALRLMEELGWSESNNLVMGGTGDGYVFVQVPKESSKGL